jgi:hypothetical protein
MIRPNGDGLYIGADEDDSGGSGTDIRLNIKGDEKMRIKSDGNVGIGTTDPDLKLEVAGSLTSGQAPNTRSKVSLQPSNTINRSLDIYSDGVINSYNTNYPTAGNGGLQFQIAASTHLSIKGGDPSDATFGNVGIGTTNPSAKLEIAQSDGFANDGIILNYLPSTYPNKYKSHIYHGGDGSLILESWAGAATLAGDILLAPNGGSVGIGTTNPGSYKLNVNGTARVVHSVNGSQEVTSDDRVKHNEQPIVGALETLGKITPKKYIKTTEMYDANHDFELDADGNPIDANGEPVEHRIEAGVIAQQVLTVDELAFAVSPEDVDEDGVVTSPYGLDYNSLFTYAIAAIQEQQEIIETQNSRIDELISRIETLEQ